MIQRKIRAAVLLAAAAIAASPRLSAQTISWLSPVSGDWFDGSKWSPPVVPNSTSARALFAATGSAYSVSLGNSVTLNGLDLQAPAITLVQSAGDMNLSGNSTIAAGQFSVAGTLSGTGAITNFGTFTFTSTNKSFGTNLTLANSGYITATGGNYTVWQGSLANNGTVALAVNSDLQFRGGVESTGCFDIGAGAYLTFWNQFSSNPTNLNGGTLVGTGTVRFLGGINNVNIPWGFGGTTQVFSAFNPTVNFNAPVTGGLEISGGTTNFAQSWTPGGVSIISGGYVNAPGSISLSGLMTWSGGTFAGTSRINVLTGGTLNLQQGGNVNLDVVSSGTINVVGPSLVLGDGKKITNQSGGVLWQDNPGIFSAGASTIENAGRFHMVASNKSFGRNVTINNTGSITTQVASSPLQYIAYEGLVQNSGTINVSGAELVLYGGGTSTGSIVVNGGSGLGFQQAVGYPTPTFNFEAGSSVSGSGQVSFYGGVNNINTPWTFGGVTRIWGGTVNFNAPVTGGLEISGGTTNFAQSWTPGGVSIISGGYVNAPGSISLSGLMTWSGGTFAGTSRINVLTGGTLNLQQGGNVNLNNLARVRAVASALIAMK